MKKIITIALMMFNLANAEIEIKDIWVRPSMGSNKNTACYMNLLNKDEITDNLIEVKSDISDHVHLHKSVTENNVTTMVNIDKLALPYNTLVKLEPGSLHIMLMQIKKPLKEGDEIELELVFEKNGTKKIKAKVEVK